MAFLYHARPARVRGDTLYPLNDLLDVDRGLYEAERRKYDGRAELLDLRIPVLDVLWNDALHLAPIHPAHLAAAWRAAGLSRTVWQREFFEIPLERIDVKRAVWFDRGVLPLDGVEPFDPARHRELPQPPPAYGVYLGQCRERGRRPRPFAYLPHVLVAAPIHVAGLRSCGARVAAVTDAFPLPGSSRAVVAVEAPGRGRGWWAGSSSAALDEDGTFVVAYRVRTGERGRGSTVVARSEDGERFTTVATLEQARFDAQSMERPALVRTDEGRWRLYVCPASPAPSKHWWIDVLEADDPADLATAEARTVFPGDERTGVKDPLVQRTPDGAWQAWVCCHPLDVPDEEDRMTTAYATSADGLEWEWHGTVLAPRPGRWDARGARVTAVLPDGRAAYDGRATKEENWFERIGLARLTGERPGELEQTNEDAAVDDARYLDVLPLPGGGYRIWYEARLLDETHELRTELLASAIDSPRVDRSFQTGRRRSLRP